MQEYKFCAKKITRYLGGAIKLVKHHADLAKKFGWDSLPLNTIYSWNNRNCIPPTRIGELYTIGKSIGCPLTAEVMVSPVEAKPEKAKKK